MQRVYKYIIKVETMPDHRLQKQAWNIGQKAPKFNESKRSHLVDTTKWFKRWRVVELSVDVMKYVIIKDRFLG